MRTIVPTQQSQERPDNQVKEPETPVTSRRRWVTLVCLIGIVLLGATLRWYRLGYQSLWLDEAYSNWLAGFPVTTIIAKTITVEPNPPLYFLGLHSWIKLAGRTEFSLRDFSLVAGVLLLPLLYALGRRLFSARVGLIAALIAAINPFLVWYSQEARMYGLLALLGTLSSYCLWRALEPGPVRRRYWIGFVAATLAGFYTHLFAIFLFLFQPFWIALVWVPRWRAWRREPVRRPWLMFFNQSQGLAALVSLAAISLLFVPWLPVVFHFSNPSFNWRPVVSLPELLVGLLAAFSYRVLLGTLVAPVLFFYGLLAVMGIVWGFWFRTTGFVKRRYILQQPTLPPAILFLLLWLVIPIGVIYLISLSKPLYDPRYFILLSPAFYLLLARGIVGTGQGVAGLAGRVIYYWGKGLPGAGRQIASFLSLLVMFMLFLPIASFSATALQQDYGNALVAREGWRDAAHYVATHAGPNDAIIPLASYTYIPFTYYYYGVEHGTLPYYLPPDVIPDDSTARGFLEGTVLPHHPHKIWLILSHQNFADPQNHLFNLLGGRYPEAAQHYDNFIAIHAFNVGFRLLDAPDRTTTQVVNFGDRLALLGYTVDTHRYRVQPDAWIHLTLYWIPLDQYLSAYSPVVRLVDSGGQVWGERLARHDVFQVHPPSTWDSGEIIEDDYDININPRIPPGSYHLAVGLAPPGKTAPVLQMLDRHHTTRGTLAVFDTIEVRR